MSLQPNVMDAVQTTAFTPIISKAFLAFHAKEPTEAIKRLPELFAALMPNFASKQEDVGRITMQSLKVATFSITAEVLRK